MAKLAVTLTVIYFLFAFSHALTPLDLQENDVTFRDISTTVPESETKTTAIVLPSAKPESEPATMVEFEPETTLSKPGPWEKEALDSDTDSAPLTVISFRPINHRFPSRPLPLQFRHRHRCRHGHHQFKPWGPRQHGRNEFSYGNDMILSGDDVSSDQVPRGGNNVRQIPARWVRLHHNHGRPRFPLRRDDMGRGGDMKRPHHHVEREEKERKERDGGVMWRFRKFLNQF